MALTPAEMNQRTLQILLRQQLLSPEAAEAVSELAIRRHIWVGQAAVEARHLTDSALAASLSAQFDLPLVELEAHTPDSDTLACLPRDFCLRYQVVPFARERGVLHLAVANPLQDLRAEALPHPRAFGIVLHLAPLRAVRQAIERWYGMMGKRERGKAAPRDVVIATAAAEEFTTQLHDLLGAMLEHDGTDLHLTLDMRPLMRVGGELQPLPFPRLDAALLRRLVYAILSDAQIAAFEAHHELDLAYALPEGTRFRVNLFHQRGAVGAIFRIIPAEIPSLQSLGYSAAVQQLARKSHGLVLVTGPDGSGRSTTLAAMIEEINRARHAHIITIEDPIEFIHRSAKSEINQRQVGADTANYQVALQQALRQDPDVILVDRLPDRETIAAALATAETGHLVFASLPTLGAVATLQHLLHAFPVPMHLQMCARLANVVEGILTQVLIRDEEGGIACAREILLATPAVRTCIREGKITRLPAHMRGGKDGMMLLEQSLRKLQPERTGRSGLRALLAAAKRDHPAA